LVCLLYFYCSELGGMIWQVFVGVVLFWNWVMPKTETTSP
jgi:hypothetical protein